MHKFAAPVIRAAVRGLARTTDVRRFNGTALRVPRRAALHVPPYVDLDYDPLEWRAIECVGRAGDSFLDVGANIGVMSALMSRVAGTSGRVIAVEPQPSVYAMLVELLDENGCSNVTAVQALLLDHCGAADLRVSTATPLGVGSSWLDHDTTATKNVRVPALTIDALYESEQRLDYVKIDAEGAEEIVLRGAMGVLRRCRPTVQVEVHGQYMVDRNAGVSALFDLMTECGYRTLNLATGAETPALEFLRDTGHHVVDPQSGDDLAHRGYGHVLFVHRERADLLERVAGARAFTKPTTLS